LNHCSSSGKRRCSRISYSIEVHKVKEKAVYGKYDIPEFQRGFVWGPEKVKDLADSLWRKYPIGTFLLWDTLEYSSPRTAEGVERERLWIVDGQQRTTALCLLFGKKPYWWQDVDEWNRLLGKCDVLVRISDAQPVEFALPNPVRRKEPGWISLRSIINSSDEELSKTTMDLLIKNGKQPTDTAAFTEIHARLKSLQEIKDKPVIVMEVDHDVEDVAEIFSRLNTKGTKVKDTDVAVALIAARQPGWNREEFLPFLKGLEIKGYDFDPSVLVRTLAALGRGTSRLKDVKRDFWESQEFYNAWGKTKDAVSYIIKKMTERGILSAELLPSHNALIPLFALYDQFSFKDFVFEKGLHWLIRATWAGRYSGSATTTLNQDLNIIKNANTFSEAIALLLKALEGVLPERIDEDYLLADYRDGFLQLLLFLVIFDAGAIDWIQKVRIGFDKTENVLNEGFYPQWHHFFPKSVLEKNNVNELLINATANITVLTEKQRAFRSIPEQYINKYKIPEEQLKQQFIPTNPDLWKVEHYEEFLDARKRQLAEAMNSFLDKLRS